MTNYPLIISEIPGFLKNGETASVFRFKNGESLFKHGGPIGYKACCFSFYCKKLSGNGRLVMQLSDDDGFAKNIVSFCPTEEWDRYYISIESIYKINTVTFRIFFEGEGEFDCSLAHPQLVRGNVPLPYIPPGATSGRGSLYFNLEDNKTIVFPTGTWVIKFMVDVWKSHTLMRDRFATIVSFLESDQREVLIGFDGESEGRLVIMIRENDEFNKILTDYYLNSSAHQMLLLTFDRKSAYIYINDRPIWSGNIIFNSPTRLMYIGSPSDHCYKIERYNDFSLTGYISEVQGYKTSKFHEDIKLLSEYLHTHTEVNPRINGLDLIDTYFNEDEYEFINELEYAIINSFKYLKKHDNEERIRDHYSAFMEGRELCVVREDYQAAGRTDILLKFNEKVSNYRIEFKIWGRHGYNEAPKQPIKYMNINEKVSAFVMYDYGAIDKFENMKEIFVNCADYKFSGQLLDNEQGVFKTNIRFFLSEHHKDDANKVLIIAVYIKI